MTYKNIEINVSRFTNDLFFWSPLFPTPTSHGGDTTRLSHILNKTHFFAPCKSGIQFGILNTISLFFLKLSLT